MNEADHAAATAAAEAYSQTVSVSHRTHADIYVGNQTFTTVTDVVRAAFLAGAQAASERLCQERDEWRKAAETTLETVLDQLVTSIEGQFKRLRGAPHDH